MTRVAACLALLTLTACEHEPDAAGWIYPLGMATVLPFVTLFAAWIFGEGIGPGVPARVRRTHRAILICITAAVAFFSAACWYDFLTFTPEERVAWAAKHPVTP